MYRADWWRLPSRGKDTSESLTPDQLRSRRVRAIRPRTENLRRISPRRLEMIRQDASELEDQERPHTRGDCVRVERPCPFVGCRHNLFLDVSANGRSLKLVFPDLTPDEMDPRYSCALDVADRGEASLHETAAALNIVRERVRQIAARAISKLGLELDAEDVMTRKPMHDDNRDEREDDDEDEDEAEELAPVDDDDDDLGVTDRVLAVLRESTGGLPSRDVVRLCEARPRATGEALRSLRAEGRVRLVGRGERARWALATDKRREPAVTATAVSEQTIDVGEGHMGTNGKSAMNGTAAAAGANGAAHVPPRPMHTNERATLQIVAQFERAKRALVERRRMLAAQLAKVDATLEGASEDASEPTGTTSPPAKPHARPTPDSRVSKVLEFVTSHPNVKTADVAKALGGNTRRVSAALCALRTTGKVRSSGPRGSSTWMAQPGP